MELNKKEVWSKPAEPIIEKHVVDVILSGIYKYVCRKCGSYVEIIDNPT